MNGGAENTSYKTGNDRNGLPFAFATPPSNFPFGKSILPVATQTSRPNIPRATKSESPQSAGLFMIIGSVPLLRVVFRAVASMGQTEALAPVIFSFSQSFFCLTPQILRKTI